MIAAGDFKKNVTKLLIKKEPWVVLDFTFVKPGKGGAFVKTKLKNIKTGVIYEETFRSGEKLVEPDLEQKTMQFLYKDDMYHFMDQESFEQEAYSESQVESAKYHLQEGIDYKILVFEGEVIGIEPPIFLTMKVVETVPGVKGNTAQGSASKPAELETGIRINVPLFINEGDLIKFDTRDNKYIERA